MPFANKEKQKAYTKLRYIKNMTENPNYAKEEAAKWRKNNLEQARKLESNYRKNNKEKIKERHCKPHERFSRAKQAAKRAKREWNISKEQYFELCDKPCEYCNDTMGPRSRTGSGLDRKDSSIGYIIDNVVPCCIACNTLKSNILSYDETKKVIQLVINLRKETHNV